LVNPDEFVAGGGVVFCPELVNPALFSGAGAEAGDVVVDGVFGATCPELANPVGFEVETEAATGVAAAVVGVFGADFPELVNPDEFVAGGGVVFCPELVNPVGFEVEVVVVVFEPPPKPPPPLLLPPPPPLPLADTSAPLNVSSPKQIAVNRITQILVLFFILLFLRSCGLFLLPFEKSHIQ